MRFDAIIIGGGFAGMSAAAILQESGLKCLVIRAGEDTCRFFTDKNPVPELKRRFRRSGGTVFEGDRVCSGRVSTSDDGGWLKMTDICTEGHGDARFEADYFIFATGSFFSYGLVSTSDSIYEPIIGLDVNYEGTHCNWVNAGFFDEQPFMKFGVATDEELHPSKEGRIIVNAYAIGALVDASSDNAALTAEKAATSILNHGR